MALFGRKKNTKEEKPKVEKVVASVKEAPKKAVPTTKAPMKGSFINELILFNPRITEKATSVQQNGVYVFDVDPRAGKKEIAKAFQAVYNVVPRKVNLVKVRSRLVMGRKGLKGRRAGGKKAYVYLKKGDSIEIV
jgi:large subunit ribosomal protein L23